MAYGTSSKYGRVFGPVNVVNEPALEELDVITAAVFFQAVYEILELFSIRLSNVTFTAVGDGFGVGDALVLGAGFATGIKTPLSHTNFLPLFTQVYVLPTLTLLIPALLQELPAFTAA
jgi:hypothetical protein